MNVPKLRFKDNNGNDYPQWEKKKLEKLVSIYDGTHQTPHYVDNGIKFVSVENIKNLYASNKFILQEAFSKEFKNIPDLNDILMTRIGDVGTATLVTKNEPLAYYVSLALLKQKKEIFMPFLLQYIASNPFQKELWRRTLHIAFPKKINKNEIGKCFINLPISTEQNKIAKFLSTVDKKISNLEDIITTLEKQKKGLLQQIFNQGIRFKDENGNNYPDWEKKKLGDITQSQGGTALEKYSNTKGLYKFISIGNYSTNSTYLDNGARIDLNDKTKKQLLNKNDLVMILNDKTSSGNIIGRTLLIDKDNTYIYNQRSQRLICNTKIIIPPFLYFLLNSDFRKNIRKKIQGATQIYINYSTIEEMYLNIPCLKEQTKIADFLSAFDRKIDNQKAQLEHWKQIKKGLLQQMFV